jgi:hypothetical protein
MIRRLALGLLFAATLMHRADAQDPRLIARFPAPAALRLNALVDSAGREGLPTEPLVLRALEGQAKGATTDQISTALSRLRDALRTARQALDPSATAADLTTGAAALQAGVPSARLAELHHLRGSQGISAPLGAYLDLMARGANAGRAWSRIADLAKHRASDADFVRLTPQDIDRDAGDARVVHRPGTTLARIETGGGQSQLDQLPSGSLASLNGAVETWLPRMHLELSGAGENHINLGVAGIGHGAVHAGVTAAGWQFEGGPVVDVARDVAMPWTSTLFGDVTASRTFGVVSLTGEMAAGVAHIAGPARNWTRPALNVAVQAGPVRFDAGWQSLGLQDTAATHFVDSSPDSNAQRITQKFNDVSVGLGWSAHLLSVSGHLGRRTSTFGLAQTWWNAGAALHVAPTVALTAQAGRAPSNVLMAMRSAQYATVGLRFDIARNRTGNVDRDFSYAAAIVVRETPKSIRISLALAPGVQHAALTGDLTEWTPVELTRDPSGRWTARLAASAGTYRINVRTDTGTWQVPPGMPASDDGFGNRVGLLVVE